jgi:hypothetical protein
MCEEQGRLTTLTDGLCLWPRIRDGDILLMGGRDGLGGIIADYISIVDKVLHMCLTIA